MAESKDEEISEKTPLTKEILKIEEDCKRFKLLSRIPTADQIRWPVQVGCAAGLASVAFWLPERAERFFKSSGIIGTAITVTAIEATAGGSLKRAWSMALLGSFGAFSAFCLFVGSLSVSESVGSGIMPYLILLSIALLVVPPMYVRYFNQDLTSAVNTNLTTAEVLLLASYGSRLFVRRHVVEYAALRAVAAILAPLCSAVVSQFVMRKAARPQLVKNLSKILSNIAEVLDRLTALLNTANHQSVTSKFVIHSPKQKGGSFFLPSSSIAITCTEDIPLKLKEVAVDVSSSEGQSCGQMMQELNTCQELLGKQKDLIMSAKQEISLRRPHFFPVKEYTDVLNEIHHLFIDRVFSFHIASLVFALNLYVASPAVPLKSKGDMSSVLQTIKVPSWIATVTKKSNNESRPKVPQLRIPKTIEKDIWMTDEGALIAKVTKHLTNALRCIVDCLQNQEVTGAATAVQIKLATEAIMEVNVRRHRQRVAFADIMLATLKSDVYEEWVPTISEKLDWMSSIGISALTFLNFTEEEKLVYWDAYWLGRDRISTSSVTLTTLRDSLLRLCGLVDEYVCVAVQ